MERPSIRLNVLAKDIGNAKELVQITNGNILIGVMVKSYPSISTAVETVKRYQAEKIPVSVGLGAGDPSQWERVVQVAEATGPDHVNQVFPAAGFTVASVKRSGHLHTVVNGLITPSGTAGKVFISTGPLSQLYQDQISCDSAAAILAEVGVQSVKFYPVHGVDRLDEVKAMAKAAAKQGIEVFEPTGGVKAESLPYLLETCLSEGIRVVIPHIYTSIVDPVSGLTRAQDVEELMEVVQRYA